MTINLSTNSPRVSYTVSEGATTSSFTVSFEFFAAADLNVYVDGATKVLGSGSGQYAVSGGDGSTGAVALSVTGATGGSTVVITRDIGLERTTDFPSSGSFQISTLNTELDRFVAIAADLKDSSDRALQISDFDSAVSLVIPAVATRKGTVLGFNASTGAVEAGPNITAVQSLSAVTTAINLLGTSAVVTDLGILGTAAIVEDMALLGTSANVTAMGLLGNSTTIADLAILATTDVVADLAILATSDIVTDLNVLATSDIVTDLNVLATSDIVTDLNVLATTSIVADMAALADGGALNITGTPSFNASLGVKNGATSAGYINFFEDSDNGTNKVTLIGPAATADVTLTLPASTDTLVGKATTDTLTNKTLTSPDINSPDIDGGTIDAITRLTTLAEDVTFSSTVANKPVVTIENTTNHSGAATLRFINTQTGSSGQDNDPAGTIEFKGENDNNESIRYASIEAYALDVSDGDEGGKLALSVASHDGQGSYGLVLQDGNADDEVDVTIASGAASITTVEGTLTMGSTATLNNTGVLQTAAQTNITSVGTLTSVDVTGVAGAATFEPDGDTASGDNAAIGYTAAEGLILTGQGSTGDVTIKNDADAVVLQVPTGTTNVNIVGNVNVGDGKQISFGNDGDISLTHVADSGLLLKQNATADNSFAKLIFQTGATSIGYSTPYLGEILFQAPDASAGGDSTIVSGGIACMAESTFTSTSNATKLSFRTSVSEVAAEKMQLSSVGKLTFTGDLQFSGAITATMNGGVRISNTTASTNTVSGALVVAGGLGVAGDIYIGDDLFVGDDLDVSGAAVIDGTALVTGVLTTTAATVSNGGGQFNGAINVGVDGTGYDVKFFGDTASSYMLWDQSTDDLILGGVATMGIGTASPSDYSNYAHNLVIYEAGHAGITIATNGDNHTSIYFADGTSGNTAYRGQIVYNHSGDSLTFKVAGDVTAATISATGSVNLPLQPAFLVQPAGTQHDIPINATTAVVFGTERFDQASNFASNTFTAPVAGKYQFNVQMYLLNVDIDSTYLQFNLTTSNRSYIHISAPPSSDADLTYYSPVISVLAEMDADDTAIVTITIPNSGAAQMDVNATTAFSGFLAC